MSGSQGGGAQRERREVIPQASGVAGVPSIATPSTRDARMTVGYETQAIAQVLDPLERQATRAIGEDAIRRAEADAASEPFNRDEEGRLVPPNVEQGFMESRYDTRRREVLTSRYASEMVTDTNAAIVRLRGQAERDPDRFQAAATGWRDGLVQNLPPALRGPVGATLTRVISQHHNEMLGQRLEAETAQARTLAIQAAQTIATDITDQSAMPPGPARDAGLAASRARAEAFIEAHRGILGGEATERLRRDLLVVRPAMAELRGNLRRDAANQGQMITALLGGPGTPGWNPAWAQLTQEERSDLARFGDAIINHQRGEIRYGRAEQEHSQRQAEGALLLQAAGMATAPSPDAAAMVELQTQVLAAVRTGRIGQDGAARILRTINGDRQVVMERRSNDEMARIVGDQAREALAALAPTGDAIALRIQNNPDLTLPDMTRLLTNRVGVLEREADALSRRAVPLREALEGMTGDGTRRLSLERHGEALMSLLDAGNSGRAAWASAGPSERAAVAERVTSAVRTSVVPEPLRNFYRSGGGAWADEQSFRNAGTMMAAIMDDPDARAAMSTALGPQQWAAWSMVAREIRQLPPESPSEAGDRTASVTAAIRRNAQEMMVRGPAPREAIDARLPGDTPAKRQESLDALLQRTAGDQLSWWQRNFSWIASRPDQLSPEYRDALREQFYSMAQFTEEPEAAARLAVDRLGQTWGPSSTAMTRSGWRGQGPGGARYVQHPPEQFAARSGRGGEVSADWQHDFANDALRAAGVPMPRATGADGQPVESQFRLGVNAFWQLDEAAVRAGQGPRYHLWFQDRSTGVTTWNTLPGRHLPGTGRPSAEPATFDLGAAAAARTAEWIARNRAGDVPDTTTQERREETRQRVRGNPGNLQVPGGAAVRSQPQAQQPPADQAPEYARGWSDRARAEAGLPLRPRRAQETEE